MSKTKIILAALTTAMAVTSLGGCGQKTEKTQVGDGSVVLKYLMPGPGEQQDSKKVFALFNEKLHERLPNVTVDFEIIPFAEYGQQFMLMQTSRETIDIANTYGISSDPGNFTPIEDLVEQYGQDVKAALPEWLWGYSTWDDHIWGVPSYQMMAVQRAIVTQKPLADQYLDKEALQKELFDHDECTDKTFDILEDYLKKLYDSGNIQYGFYHWLELPQKGYEQIGNFFVRWWDNSYKVEYKFEIEQQKRAYSRYADWYKKGYIRADSLSANDSSQRLDKMDGYVLWNEVWDPFKTDAYKNKGLDFEAVPFLDEYFIPMANAAGHTSITENCEHKAEAMQVLNIIQSDKEMYNLLVYGIEGEHYNKVSENRIERIKGASEKYGLDKWIVGNTSLAYLTENEPDEYYDWVFNEVNNSELRSQLIGIKLDLPSDIDTKMQQIEAVKGEYMSTIASGSLGDGWKVKYDEWMEKAEAAGLSDVRAAIQKGVDDFLDSKGYVYDKSKR